MKYISVDVLDDNDVVYWTVKDIKNLLGVAQSTANKYVTEFFQFAHEKHIYPMNCAFNFFNKKVVNKYAFFHYYQYRDNIVNGNIYEEFNDKFILKMQKLMVRKVN